METHFRMPAEWETHEGTWIAWPHEESDFPGKIDCINWVYTEFVRHVSRRERVHILVQDEADREQVTNYLRDGGARLDFVDLLVYPTDRSWTRDYCPIFVKNKFNEIALLDFKFNAWAKYENWQADDGAPQFVANHWGMRAIEPEHKGVRAVLEGGSIDVNGAGAILTTEECLLSRVQQRNSSFHREDYEALFANYLGCTKTIWLRNGIAGDDTHGHVDDLARFIGKNTILLAVEEDTGDANYEPTQENVRLLKERAPDMRMVHLPFPEPVYFAEQRLPASYANFYIVNHAILVPTFNDANDRIALNIIAEACPSRAVIGINATDLVLGLGTLHCMTQQQPA